jgi:DNA-directed RNA polymerase I, II, and III subunit RPABC2
MFEEKDDIESDVESNVEEKDVKKTEDDSNYEDEVTVNDSDVDATEDEDEDDEEENLPEMQKQPSAFIEPEDDDDEDEEDSDYLQKFDDSIKQNIIANYHPELKNHNYDEIEVLSRVVRDNTGAIVDPLHKTLPFVTKYEKARILGERAAQINAGAVPFVEVDVDVIDGYLIALKEFEQKKIPFIVKRPLPNGSVEYWKLEDMEYL